MRRRELLGALSAGVVGVGTGCLGRATEPTECSPFSRFGIGVVNLRERPQTVEVDVRTRWLRRETFSETVRVPAATDSGGAGIAYEPDVLRDLGSYSASVTHDGRTYARSFRVECTDLMIEINPADHPLPTVDLDLMTLDAFDER